MYIRLATLSVAGLLLAAPALAATDSTRSVRTAEECTQLINVTKTTVHDQNDAGEKAQNEVDKLLLALEEQCNQSEFDRAEETAAYIRGLIATE